MIIAAPTAISENATVLSFLRMKISPESMTMIPAATKSGLIVGVGIGMPSSFAERRSFSMCTGFASAAFSWFAGVLTSPAALAIIGIVAAAAVAFLALGAWLSRIALPSLAWSKGASR